jgi:hypothetical protein
MDDLPFETKSCVPSGALGGTIAEAGLTKVTESAVDKTIAASFPLLPMLLSIKAPSVKGWISPSLAVFLLKVDSKVTSVTKWVKRL